MPPLLRSVRQSALIMCLLHVWLLSRVSEWVIWAASEAETQTEQHENAILILKRVCVVQGTNDQEIGPRTALCEEENCNLRMPQAPSAIVCAVKHFLWWKKLLVKKNKTFPLLLLLLLPVRKVDSREKILFLYLLCCCCYLLLLLSFVPVEDF